MADEARGSTRKRSRKRKIRFFYLNGDLHQVLRVVKPSDLCYAWNYPKRTRVTYVWSDVQKNMQNAFTATETGKLLNRNRQVILQSIWDGAIEKPQMRYKMDGSFVDTIYMLSEDDVLGIHEHLVSLHRGRPRHDGIVVPMAMPNRAEVRAMMKHDTVVYVKSENDEFIPLWKEPEW